MNPDTNRDDDRLNNDTSDFLEFLNEKFAENVPFKPLDNSFDYVDEPGEPLLPCWHNVSREHNRSQPHLPDDPAAHYNFNVGSRGKYKKSSTNQQQQNSSNYNFSGTNSGILMAEYARSLKLQQSRLRASQRVLASDGMVQLCKHGWTIGKVNIYILIYFIMISYIIICIFAVGLG
jgi:hypothetical protein